MKTIEKKSTALLLILLAGLIVSCGMKPAPSRSPGVTAPGIPKAVMSATVRVTLSPAPVDAPTGTPRADGLTEAEAATLGSLERVDEFPLYTMYYQGSYDPRPGQAAAYLHVWSQPGPPAWGCSLFATLGDPQNRLYGRNFDWEYSPALLLFTDPPEGYASAAMVDLSYLDFDLSDLGRLDELPLAARRALLQSPYLPFDGMNEHGLAIGMAAVPPGNVPPDPGKETIGSLLVMRKVLDGATNVDEALAIMESYNIDFGGGPPIHYLIADRSGRSALVEYAGVKMVVMPNERDWDVATNFLRATAGDSAAGQCWRYDKIQGVLTQAEGKLNAQEALGLLEDVSQDITQWSVVYGISSGEIHVAIGQKYAIYHTFKLESEDVQW